LGSTRYWEANLSIKAFICSEEAGGVKAMVGLGEGVGVKVSLGVGVGVGVGLGDGVGLGINSSCPLPKILGFLILDKIAHTLKGTAVRTMPRKKYFQSTLTRRQLYQRIKTLITSELLRSHQWVDFGSQDKVVLVKTTYFVGPKLNYHFLIGMKVNVGVVPFGLCQIPYFVYKSQSLPKILKLKFPFNFSFSII
jgi:hypothetical protein